MYLNFLLFTGGSQVAERMEQNGMLRPKGNVVAFPKYVVVSDKYMLPMLEQDDNLNSRKITQNRIQNSSVMDVKFERNALAKSRGTEFVKSYTPHWKSGFRFEKDVPCKSSFRYGFGIEHEIQSLRMRLLNTRIGTAPLLTRSVDNRGRAMNNASENVNRTRKPKSRRAMTCVNLKFPASHYPVTITPSPPSTPKYCFQRTVFSAQLSNARIRNRTQTGLRRCKQKTTKGFTTGKSRLGVSYDRRYLKNQ